MLSERERQQLTEIEHWLAADYPDFPRYMSRRRRPLLDAIRSLGRRMGRRPLAILLFTLWLGGLGASIATNSWVGLWTYLIISAPFVVLAAPLAVVALIERHRRRRHGMP